MAIQAFTTEELFEKNKAVDEIIKTGKSFDEEFWSKKLTEKFYAETVFGNIVKPTEVKKPEPTEEPEPTVTDAEVDEWIEEAIPLGIKPRVYGRQER